MRYKIYIGHSRDARLDYLQDLYQPLIDALGEDMIIVPHERGVESEINSQALIPTCNLMIAEVSYPSTGLGMELAWASAAKVPTLCIHKINCAPSFSVIRLFSNILIYENVADMTRKLKAWILKNEASLDIFS